MIELLPRPRIFFDEVRDAADLEALATIHAEGFRRGWSVDEFESLLADDTVRCILLRRESVIGWRRILGFVIARNTAGEAEILTVAVLLGRRGQGFGRRLMDELLRRLYADRAAEVFLEVDESNPPAIALYRRLGFVEVGRRKGYYRGADGRESGALVLRLQLH
ncbi:ribosomal-protein-alanine acetyltransferase [Kaistia algarum]|uniref:GNAT family N-acetyltransferase n=1 Tax=Kaistia algarum TaxID=2083279 RepID=UPI000CE79152|nr:GNAT family N-acetyltransferase [Kaistia algarum]MCX5513799.1 GNAT family N-acetyltransferase [Kaistia algarum]PPE79335.1 ribosomal-protein-alanine acetyltransferase [Kaistia algarum]